MTLSLAHANGRHPLEDLIVCMPLAELGYQRYWQYLIQNPDFGWLIQNRRVITQAGGYIHHTPSVLVEEAMGRGKKRVDREGKEIPGQEVPPWKRLLWMEHDHVFPTDVFRRHAAYTQPVVGGIYTLRDSEDPMPVLYKWNDSRTSANYYNAVELHAMGIGGAEEDKGLHEVDVVPMGCTSVRRDVFENWPKDRPMFNSYMNAGGSLVGHDVWFCRIAQDAGWPIYIDTSLRVKHFGMIELDDSYFVKWWNVIGAKLAAERAGVELPT